MTAIPNARAPGVTRLTYPLAILFAWIALFGLLWMNVPGPSVLMPIEALAAAALVWVLARRLRRSSPVPAVDPFPARAPALIVGIGLVLRLAFALAYQPQQASDGAAYLHLADALAAGRPYWLPEGYAYWPPGLPIVFAPFRFCSARRRSRSSTWPRSCCSPAPSSRSRGASRAARSRAGRCC